MNYIKRIMSEIDEDINNLINHKFIIALTNGEIDKSKLNIFAEQYYLISCAFNKFLFNACGAIESEEIRAPLLENLYDEHGRGDLSKSHRELLKVFLTAVNADDIKNLVAFPSTEANIYGMNAICLNGSVNEILGALGPGCESFTTEQYTIIYNALKDKYNFLDEELIFFREHISHDPRHTADIEDVINICVQNDIDMQEVINGAKKALIYETILWDGIYQMSLKS